MDRQYHIIGDVHGCLTELQALVGQLALQPHDVLVFVGDLLDKGPDSPGVVEYVMELAQSYTVVLVEGNHEEKHRRFRKHLASGTTKVLKQMSKKEELVSITEALSEEAIKFLDEAVAYHQIPEFNVLVCHGGITPNIEELPSERHLHKMSAKDRKHFGQILRARYVDAETGKMISLGKNKKPKIKLPLAVQNKLPKALRKVLCGDPFWADVYDGRFGTVVYGHNPYHTHEEPKKHAHAVGVDLGAVYGGRLAAVTLPGFLATTVRAQRAYSEVIEED